MVRIGGSTEKGQHIKEHDYYTPTGEFRVDRGGSQILLNCLMYKMCYYRFGSVYTEQGNERVHAASLASALLRPLYSGQSKTAVSHFLINTTDFCGLLVTGLMRFHWSVFPYSPLPA